MALETYVLIPSRPALMIWESRLSAGLGVKKLAEALLTAEALLIPPFAGNKLSFLCFPSMASFTSCFGQAVFSFL